MDKPTRAGNAPIPVDLESGKTYAWCACGLSTNQPYCDGSHKPTAFKPIVFKADSSDTKYLCLCKGTANGPFCDGTHKK